MNGAMLLAEGGGMSPIILILYVAVFGGILYFMMYRPSKKEREAKEAMMAAMKARRRRGFRIKRWSRDRDGRGSQCLPGTPGGPVK